MIVEEVPPGDAEAAGPIVVLVVVRIYVKSRVWNAAGTRDSLFHHHIPQILRGFDMSWKTASCMLSILLKCMKKASTYQFQ